MAKEASQEDMESNQVDGGGGNRYRSFVVHVITSKVRDSHPVFFSVAGHGIVACHSRRCEGELFTLEYF